MSANPTISLELVDSDSFKSIDGLKGASSRVFKPVFNEPGSLSFDVDIYSPAARLARKRKTGVIFFRNNEPIWSGGITSIIKSGKAGRVAMVATGWLEELDHRFVRKAEEATLTFASPVIAGEIIQTALETCNAQTDSDGVVRPVRLSFGEASDTQTRTNAYKQGTSFGSIVRELIEIENGVDISVDPLTKQLSTRSASAFSDLAGVQFGFGMDPHNLDDLVENDDGGSIRNRESVVGPSGLVYVADDADAIEAAGVMLEEWLSLSNVVDPNVITAYANAELVYKRYGTTTYTLTPKSLGDVPRPYDDFQWGDKARLSADKGALQLDNQAVRLFSATLTYDDNGNEVMSDLTVALG